MRGRRGGLIPAHAGKTSGTCSARMRMPAHPRSRGENAVLCGLDRSVDGSSPLTRGKLDAVQRGYSTHGLIPAHAGKTSTCHPMSVQARAHPRSRGENEPRSSILPTRAGSSPLTRGKPALPVPFGDVARLIPAHAGKTLVADGVHFCVPAHPRSRGENSSARKRPASASGSSPLTRGKRLPDDSWDPRIRLIPAHAGKTHGLRA